MYKLLFTFFITETTQRQTEEFEQGSVFTPIPFEPIINGNFYQKQL